MLRRKSLRFPNGIPRAAMSGNPAQADISAVPVALNGDLRDRIAAVLIEAAEFRGVYQLHNPDMRFLADAVIAELGLRQEWAVVDADGDHVYVGHLEENADKYTVQPGDHKEIRYVTEWAADE